jgi:pimeloyl-ACP methyl ester carboxylesterase
MKRKLRGLRRRDIQLDLDLYRVDVPLSGLSDMKLSVVDLWPERAEKTIVFVHGYAGCAETWEYQANYFARAYRVVVPDLRGHGQSDAPFTEYTMSEMVADINTIAESLVLPSEFVLVGHSFGGSICVEYATAHPERLEKLVLISTAGEYPLPRGASFLTRIPPRVELSTSLERGDSCHEAHDVEQHAEVAGLAAAPGYPHAHAHHYGRTGSLLSPPRL